MKGIVSDSNNIFVWHDSEDINRMRSFPKFHLIPILCLQVMHDCVDWHCSTDYCVKLILVDENLCENCFYFSLKWFLLNSFGEMCFLEESYKLMQKIQILKLWQCPLYKIWEYAFKFKSWYFQEELVINAQLVIYSRQVNNCVILRQKRLS